jgi:hypothetical protein
LNRFIPEAIDNTARPDMTITPEQRSYARLAAENAVLWRAALLSVGASWIAIGILAFALFVVLEPVNKRLAQFALILRLGASFVGSASLMFRVAQGWLYKATETDGRFAEAKV